MAKRPLRQPLYELMRDRPAARGPVEPHVVEPDDAPAATGLPRWLSPGHMIRLPVGYVLLTVAAVVLLLVIAYMVAFASGKRVGEATFDDHGVLLSPDADERVNDPLLDRQAKDRWEGRDGSDERMTERAVEPEQSGVARPAPRTMGDRPSRSLGPLESDPRESGLWYFVLAETRRDGAERLGQFCREQGLDAYMIRAHNTRFRVFALPGFTSASDPAARDLRREIRRIGLLWKERHRNESDLGDAYLSRAQ